MLANHIEANLASFPPLNGAEIDNMMNDIYRTTTQHYLSLPTGPYDYKTVMHMEGLNTLLRELRTVQIGMMRLEAHIINLVVLPTTITTDTTHRSRVVEFKGQLPTAVPEEGTGRLMKKHEYMVETSLKRYMMGFRMSRDYAALEAGKNDVKVQLAQITGGNLKNVAHMAFTAMMVPNIRDADLSAKLYGRTRYEIRQLNFRDRTAMMYKSVNGLPRMISDVVEEIYRDCQVKPTFMFMPRNYKSFILGNQAYTQYDKAGPDGPNRLWGTGGEIRNIHGVGIYEAPEIPESGYDDDTQLSSYPTFGDYAWLKQYVDMRVEPMDSTGWRLYNQHTDQYAWIMLDELVAACPFLVRHNNFVYLRPRDLQRVAQEESVDEDSIPFHTRDQNGDLVLDTSLFNLGDPADGAAQEVTQPIAAQAFPNNPGKQAAVRGGVRCAEGSFLKHFTFLFVRAVNTYRFEDGLVAVPGADTGETLISPGELLSGTAVDNFTNLINWVGWCGIHIINARRYRRLYNLAYSDIRGGGNTYMLRHEIDLQDGHDVGDNQVRDFKTNHFAYADESSPCAHLILLPKKVNVIEGQFLHTSGFAPGDSAHNGGVESYYKSEFWAKYCGFDRFARFQEVLTAPPSGETEPAVALYKTSIAYKSDGGNGFGFVVGQTHHGQYEGPGCRDIRRCGIEPYPTIQQLAMR